MMLQNKWLFGVYWLLFGIMLSVSPPALAEPELVMFEEDSCSWCEEWHRVIGPIYGKTEEGKRVPLRRVDILSARPDDLKPVKGVYFTPTFVLMNNGREIGRILGYPGEDFFWSQLAELIGKLDRQVAAAR